MPDEPVDVLTIPPVAHLWLEVAALRVQVRRLQSEVTDLKARLATLGDTHAD